MSTQNALAQRLKALHVPGNPLILTNVWDSITASAIASLPETQALATASYAVAAAAGLQDQELDLETNLRAVAGIAKAAKAADKPLTVDFQDGFGEQLEENVRRLVRLGVVGMNLEDHGREVGGLYDVDVAAERVRRALKVAAEEGVPDFVINARTDALLTGLDIDEAIKRGKAYLAAGATTAFLWGGQKRGGMRTEEVMKASEALAGMINVSLVRIMPGGLTVAELKEIGVARISVGPQVMMRTIGAVKEEAGKVLRGEGL